MTEDQTPPPISFMELRQLQKLGLAEKTTGAKPKKPMRKVSAKKEAELAAEKESRGENATELQQWYERIMFSEEGKCWETDERIDKNDKMGWHGSVAHCLPKNEYPSVATHPMNYMILKMWGGTHGQYDSSWENASKMKVWKHACKVFNILYPCLTAEEKRKLPDIIIQEIKPEIYNK